MINKNWIINNLGLKITALILAIITWLYVGGELNRIKAREKAIHYYRVEEPTPGDIE